MPQVFAGAVRRTCHPESIAPLLRRDAPSVCRRCGGEQHPPRALIPRSRREQEPIECQRQAHPSAAGLPHGEFDRHRAGRLLRGPSCGFLGCTGRWHDATEHRIFQHGRRRLGQPWQSLLDSQKVDEVAIAKPRHRHEPAGVILHIEDLWRRLPHHGLGDRIGSDGFKRRHRDRRHEQNCPQHQHVTMEKTSSRHRRPEGSRDRRSNRVGRWDWAQTRPSVGKKYRLRKRARLPLPYLAAYPPAPDFVAELQWEGRTIGPSGTITTRGHPDRGFLSLALRACMGTPLPPSKPEAQARESVPPTPTASAGRPEPPACRQRRTTADRATPTRATRAPPKTH